MNPFTPNECRVLGVLVEKAQTTPAQYPMTLNAIVLGCNQKSNRHPVTNLTEDDALDALDALRAKGVAREVMLTGSRVAKYRHVARDALAVNTTELVLLAELMLRGPQSIGQLRGRASRMHPIESLETAQAALDALSTPRSVDVTSTDPATPPRTVERTAMVVRVPAPPGSRADRYRQLLCPQMHASMDTWESAEEDNTPAAAHASPSPISAPRAAGAHTASLPAAADLVRRLDAAESQIADLTAAVSRLAAALGEPDPFG